MAVTRPRPTGLPWYIRLRGLNVFLLFLAACFYITLFINSKLSGNHHTAKGPLISVLASMITDGSELYVALYKDTSAFRTRKSLAWAIAVDIMLAIGLFIGSLTTGAFYRDSLALPTVLTSDLILLSVTHWVTMSFICREEHLRRREASRQKSIQILESGRVVGA